MPQISPFSTWILTSSSAWTVPYFPEKVLLTCSIWINVSSSPSEKRDFRTSQVFAVSVILRVNKSPEAFTLPAHFLALTGNYFCIQVPGCTTKHLAVKKRPGNPHTTATTHIVHVISSRISHTCISFPTACYPAVQCFLIV